ncbi:hypothetical protein M9H77_32881 [Catharanthus roseus]|uniref:Uncharacterized protein n=1 Tax=Catharanthus roseus TaxID=4058 RepID=A0ACC0A666_CATRO|nr:hypothetical protein M9H77_32881 [Catharanthus roseus]
MIIIYMPDRNAAPIPWIGLYIATASAICFLAMAADAFFGFRRNKLWFPCRFFTLNAASSTILAVAAKITGDLNTRLWGKQDMIAKLSSIVLVVTALGNFTTSLGLMYNNEMLANVAALGIFIITVIVNVSLHLCTDPLDSRIGGEYLLGMLFLFVLFMAIVSASLALPTTKLHIEAKYYEKEELALNEDEEAGETGKLSTKNLKLLVKRYWVMAATGNPQFVTARSAVCAMSGSICLLGALTLMKAEVRMNFYEWEKTQFKSDYKWSTIYILVIQCLAIAVGTIASTMRWFSAVRFKFSDMGSKNFKDEFKVETYWTQRLEEWKGSSLPFQIQSIKHRKLVQNTKHLILSFCIYFQVSFVVASQLLLRFHVLCLSPFLLFHKCIGRRFNQKNESRGLELDLNRFVLLLEGESGIPEKALRNIFTEGDRLILKGKKTQPKALLELLQSACSFNSLADFDNDQIPSLYSQEPPSCWTLPIVTITSIALSLPNINNEIADHLVKSVSQGLHYANLTQKYQDCSGNALHIQNASDILWVGVELYRNWVDLKLGNIDGSTSKEVIKELANLAERMVMEFKMNSNGQMENPIHWPVKIIAANSMYRISKTILRNCEDGNEMITDEQLFQKLSVTIADIFACCFTNIPRVITLKCQCSAIEDRERSVGGAAILLGETENILELVEQLQSSGIVPDQAASIDEWRVWVQQRNSMASVSASSPEI